MPSSLIVMQKMLDTYITTSMFRFPAIDGYGYYSWTALYFWPPALISLLFSKFFSYAYTGEIHSYMLVSVVCNTIRSWSGVKHLCVPIVDQLHEGFHQWARHNWVFSLQHPTVSFPWGQEGGRRSVKNIPLLRMCQSQRSPQWLFWTSSVFSQLELCYQASPHLQVLTSPVASFCSSLASAGWYTALLKETKPGGTWRDKKILYIQVILEFIGMMQSTGGGSSSKLGWKADATVAWRAFVKEIRLSSLAACSCPFLCFDTKDDAAGDQGADLSENKYSKQNIVSLLGRGGTGGGELGLLHVWEMQWCENQQFAKLLAASCEQSV